MKLRFNCLEDVCGHLNNIEVHNHRTLRAWSAGQNFYHLASAFEGSTTGLPKGFPFIIRMVSRQFRGIATRFRFPPLVPIPSAIKYKLEPPSDVEFVEQKARLKAAIAEFQAFDGVHPPHPVFGALTRQEWIGFHLRHCEHHLAFILVE